LGRNTALALQAFTELQPFVDENHHDQVLDLSSAPILFQLQNDAELMAYIQGCDGDIENLDLKQVFVTFETFLESMRLTYVSTYNRYILLL
jgi:hypothetical protein